ncbi:MAG TPA: hypothetical protein VL588_06805 [Bdellovibrionota bacterium]|nr:hypothetical protein [Bdellovibrionota bacterium]
MSKSTSLLSFSAFIIAGSAALAACQPKPDPAPNLVIAVDPANPTTQAVAPFNYGSVNLTQSATHTFSVTNTGDLPGTLRDVTSGGTKLATPFALSTSATPAEGATPECATGTVLQPGQGCVFEVTFAPVDELSYSDGVELAYDYANEDGKAASGQSTLGLIGKGKLDCSVSAELTADKQHGIDDANAQMQADAARGTADGQALTYQDGQTDGYNAGYTNGYNAGYHSPQGYDLGHSDGYTIGYNRGLSDTASCTRGSTDGYNRGVSDGNTVGRNDGYDDGYDVGYAAGSSSGYDNGYDDGYVDGKIDGYNEGASSASSTGRSDGYTDGYDAYYPNGYDDGYWDGANSCSGSGSQTLNGSEGGTSGNGSDPLPTDKYGKACYDQGYNGTYSTSAYYNAYNAAKAANQQYQSGYSEGYGRGQTDGRVNGTADGYRDGKAAGDHDGFVAGSSVEYGNCYNASYPSGYTAGYNSGYNTGYSNGWNDGDYDGYHTTYNQGYNVGYDDGFDDGYQPGYDATYADAYTNGYNSGENDGYATGYDDGYADGQYDTCGGSGSQPASTLQVLRQRDRTPEIGERPADYLAGNEVQQAKLAAQASGTPLPSTLKLRKVGHPTPALPDSLTLSPDEQAQINGPDGISSLSNPLSLRNFLRTELTSIYGGGRDKNAPHVPKDQSSPIWSALEAHKAERLPKELLKKN